MFQVSFKQPTYGNSCVFLTCSSLTNHNHIFYFNFLRRKTKLRKNFIFFVTLRNSTINIIFSYVVKQIMKTYFYKKFKSLNYFCVF